MTTDIPDSIVPELQRELAETRAQYARLREVYEVSRKEHFELLTDLGEHKALLMSHEGRIAKLEKELAQKRDQLAYHLERNSELVRQLAIVGEKAAPFPSRAELRREVHRAHVGLIRLTKLIETAKAAGVGSVPVVAVEVAMHPTAEEMSREMEAATKKES